MKKPDYFSILFFVIAFLSWGAVSQPLWSQTFPDLLLPELETPLEEDDPEEDDFHKTLFPSINALTAGDEDETLAKYSKNAPAFEKVFEPVLASARQSLVIVRSTGSSKSRRAKKRQLALGTLVSEKGWVLTKASELKGKIYCEMAAGELLEAEIYGLDPEYDLALLKLLDPEDRVWKMGEWAGSDAALTGDWLATPLGPESESQVGVVSVDSRLIPPSKPFIGIMMQDAEPTGVTIKEVQSKTPASKAGLKAEDQILKINDEVVKDIAGLRKSLEQFDAGDLITLSIVRNEKGRSVRLTLANRDKVSSENMRSNQQNSMGTRLSGRRKNFPAAFQHDTTLQAIECGGPLVNLDGEIVGVNIARAGRVASLAIPADEVMKIVDKLGSGRFTPEVVNAERIKKVNDEISDTEQFSQELVEKIERLQTEQAEGALEMPGYQAAVDDMLRKLEKLKKEIEEDKNQLTESKREVSRMKQLVKELEKERHRLTTGVK